jgi:hypothetical protein
LQKREGTRNSRKQKQYKQAIEKKNLSNKKIFFSSEKANMQIILL